MDGASWFPPTIGQGCVLALAAVPIYIWVIAMGEGFASLRAKLIAAPLIAVFLLLGWPLIMLLLLRGLVAERKLLAAAFVLLVSLAYYGGVGLALFACRDTGPVRIYAERPDQ